MPNASDKELQDFFALWHKVVSQPPEVILPQRTPKLSVNITDLISLIHRLIKDRLCDLMTCAVNGVLNEQALYRINYTVASLFMELSSRGYISCQIECQLINFRNHPSDPGVVVPDNLYTWLLMEGVILPFEFIQKIIVQDVAGRITLTLPATSRWLSGYEIPFAGRTIFYYPERCEFGILEQKNER